MDVDAPVAARRAALRILCGLLAFGSAEAASYRNPLPIDAGALGDVTSCADPTLVRAREADDPHWYMLCTQDPLSGADRDAGGALVFRRIPIFRSFDLVDWQFVGEAFDAPPAWAAAGAALWAPEIVPAPGASGYLLYVAVTDVRDFVSGEPGCGNDSAIAVATAPRPSGPWTFHGSPVVAPRRAAPGCSFLSTIDPEVIEEDGGQRYLFYGGYAGGIRARALASDGLSSFAVTDVAIATERYEGPALHRRDGFWYLFVSPNGCCNGDLTGYSIMTGRSSALLGPYVDREGVRLDASRTGGTPALTINGGPFVGPGHGTVFDDEAGNSWLLAHAIVRDDPFFEGEPGFTRRPAVLDPIAWDDDGWPRVRGGFGLSTCISEGPAAQPGTTSEPFDPRIADDTPGALLPAHSDEFDGALGPGWSWIREPPATSWTVGDGILAMETSSGELYESSNSAPVLERAAPTGDFVVETRVSLDVPETGAGHDFVQAGLVVRASDDRYLKVVVVAIGGTRQVEFGKELEPRGSGWPRFGGTGAGPPGTWTTLRLVKRLVGDEEHWTAWTSADDRPFVRGGTWTHTLGSGATIGLVAMNRTGYEARFEYLRSFALEPYPCLAPLSLDPCDRAPGEVAPLLLARTTATRLTWPETDRADVYDVLRGDAASLAAGGDGICLASAVDATTIDDVDLPSPGDAFTYLVRGADAFCDDEGPWGKTSAGEPRTSDACP